MYLLIQGYHYKQDTFNPRNTLWFTDHIYIYIPSHLITALCHRWDRYKHFYFTKKGTEGRDGPVTFLRMFPKWQKKKANKRLLASSLVLLPTNSIASLDQ